MQEGASCPGFFGYRMFLFHYRNGEADDACNLYGLLRMDLQGKYENREVIEPILEIVNQYFYTCFGVKYILTKAVPAARERIFALEKTGYGPLGEKVMGYGGYFCREDT